VRRAAPHLRRTGLLLLAAAGPWCEAGAGAHARAAIEARTGGGFAAWDLDVHGLRVRELDATVRGSRLHAAGASLGLGTDGVEIEVEGVTVTPTEAASPGSSPGPAGDDAPSAADTPTRDRFRIANRGVPIHVVARGPIALAVGGIAATFDDPTIDVDASGWPTIRTSGRVSAPRLG
jgi:hypothetical protein